MNVNREISTDGARRKNFADEEELSTPRLRRKSRASWPAVHALVILHSAVVSWKNVIKFSRTSIQSSRTSSSKSTTDIKTTSSTNDHAGAFPPTSSKKASRASTVVQIQPRAIPRYNRHRRLKVPQYIHRCIFLQLGSTIGTIMPKSKMVYAPRSGRVQRRGDGECTEVVVDVGRGTKEGRPLFRYVHMERSRLWNSRQSRTLTRPCGR